MADSPSASSRPEPKRQEMERDFGQLSRRIAGWTTNGLATALIVLAGLTLGRQVLIWWKETPAANAESRDHEISSRADAGVRQLEFGALATTFQTREVSGTRQDVMRQLRELCRPAARPEGPSAAPVEPAERRLLQELAAKEPAESGDGWRIDELPQGMPLVIGSTSVKRNSIRSKDDSDGRNGMNSVLPTPLDPRIVTIGLAVPGEEGQWTAYSFRVAGGSPAPEAEATMPLPPGSHRVMALRQPDGSILTTFRGQAQASAWEEHFRTAPPKSGWRILGKPLSAEERWHAEFLRPGAKSLRARVHFEYDGQGGLHGLSQVVPESER